MATRHNNPIYKTILGVIGFNLSIALIVGSITAYRTMPKTGNEVFIPMGIFIVGIFLTIYSVKEIVQGAQIVKELRTQTDLLKAYIIEKNDKEPK